MSKQMYKCELCGTKFHEEYDTCPHCGCPEVYEVEDDFLADKDVFGLVDEGIIPKI